MRDETALHDTVCEMNEVPVLPSSARHIVQDTTPPPVTSCSAPANVKSNAKQSRKKAAARQPSAPPRTQATRQVFSISDIQARFEAKRLAVTNKPFTRTTRESSSSSSSAASDCEEELTLPAAKRRSGVPQSSSGESDVLIASSPEAASPSTCVRPNRRSLTPRADLKKLQSQAGCAVTRKRSTVEVAVKKGNDQQVTAAKRSRVTGRCPPTAPPPSNAVDAHDYCLECGLSGGNIQARPYFRCLSASSDLLLLSLQLCSRHGCTARIHPLCAGLQSEKQRRGLCPRCCNPRLAARSNLRYIACIVASCPGDTDSFGIWLGWVALV